jgi:glycosyltransferase involved in cell wall biosynthesis
MLRIGVNALYLLPGEVGGTEIYLRNVLQALASVDSVNQYFIFRNRETGADLTPPNLNFHDCPQPVNARLRPARIAFEQTLFLRSLSRFKLDVLFNAGFTVPLLYRRPMVTVFHDLQYKRHPELFRSWDLPFWKILLPASAARSSRIIALSSAVKNDLETFYPATHGRISIVPHGVEPAFVEIARRREATPPQEPILLAVSTLHPHKNLDRLLEAFARIRNARPGWKLYLTGLKGFEAPRIEALRRELGLEKDVVITGWIPRADLYDLFARARGFVYPSRFEGFGIPVLEALAAGIPVACSRLPSLEEIAGDAARFFDPNDLEKMTRALLELTTDNSNPQHQIEQGRLRASRFTWESSARALIEIFTKIAGAHAP